MDLKALFHTPELLNDEELNVVRSKIKIQRRLPLTGAIFGGCAYAILETHIWKRARSWPLVGVAAVGGFIVGGYGAF